LDSRHGGKSRATNDRRGGREVKKILLLAYLVIGVIVAAIKDYLGDVGSLSAIINLLLAILLWPLILVGVDFDLKIGGDDGNGDDKSGKGDGKDGGKNNVLFWPGVIGIYARARVGTWLQHQRGPST
jgi:hypothetical protein